jgi:hypothetical protein
MVFRYIHLKKALAQSIATPECIQTYWRDVVSYTCVGVPLELHHRALTHTEYASLDRWVILPLEPENRQWFHILDGKELYLFKYPAPFWMAQMTFTETEGGYAITSAWLNTLVPIVSPSRKTAHVVENLLNRILACAQWVRSQHEERPKEQA